MGFFMPLLRCSTEVADGFGYAEHDDFGGSAIADDRMIGEQIAGR